MIIATHDGSFHADETIACSILTYLYPNATIIRSRDEKELDKADIVIDVSGINDEKHFDHHSNEFTLTRKNGIKYATAGIIWKKFGYDFIKQVYQEHLKDHIESIDDKLILKVIQRIDLEIMTLIDINDNGQTNDYINEHIDNNDPNVTKAVHFISDFYQNDPNIPYIVAMSNLPYVSNEEQYKNFLQTVKFLKSILVNACINAISVEFGIVKVLKIYDGSKILIMHEKLPWTQAILDNPQIFSNCLLAIYPDRKRGFRVQSLPVSKAQRFVNKVSAPKSWRGLNFKDLDKVCGIENCIFVHKTGFTGGTYDFESSFNMAQKWIEQGEYYK